MYKRILIATDGSDMASRALDHALSLAQTLGASLEAVIVLDIRVPPVALTGVPEPVFAYHESVRGELESAAKQVMTALETSARDKGVPVHSRIVDGVPAKAIVHAAEDSGADLIVMGTHGRTALGSLFLGSTAQAVLHDSKLPVLLVR